MPKKEPDTLTSTKINIRVIIALVGILVFGCLQTVQTPTAQNPQVETEYIGRVIDTNTFQPIAGAKITLDLEGVSPIVFTDSEGVYRFKVEINSDISGQIRVDAEGYQVYMRNISISSQRRSIEDIRLSALEPISSVETAAIGTTVILTVTQITQAPSSTQNISPATPRPQNTSTLPPNTLVPTNAFIPPTAMPTSGCIELLSQPWHLEGTGPQEDAEDNDVLNTLLGRNFIRITYNLHGLTALPGDASAIIFDQPIDRDWRYISLSEYGQNGLDGWQFVNIAISEFPGLNLNASVGTLHTRFWNEAHYVVDIISILACT